ncbi:PTS system IIC component, L-Asc family [Austwickia chelonae]|uniref:Ascorbate-specific PTS system EIIC component n=1 Tax=Austwickia chelonae NBRC 105200 TaxID=1184607 RepID=K6VNI1_9MICO|nr:PTS ascorbate transporter subunit IIC [Austwickia chelonae]GAB76940.1 putative phosphotransferase system enzyme IIC component [Austwickia chelonae NBRC 105200]SEW32571.1 PTS system IIC component, L-Asc family [Austwickia chelonae]
MQIANFIVNQILSVPAYLVGIITAIGLLAMGKKSGQVIGGALKATLGFLILGAGANVVVASLKPLGELILKTTGAQGVVPTNEAIVSIAAEQFGAQVAWVMIGGFLISLVIARFTPLKYVFLTGHHMFFMATMLTVVLSVAKPSPVLQVVVASVLLGTIMTVMPAISQPYTKKVTGNDKLAIGHFGTLGYVAAGAVGQAVGRTSPSTEDIKVPEGLRFLRDSMVATALSMVLFYVVFCSWAWAKLGSDIAFPMLKAADGGEFIMKGVAQGLQFGIGVSIILYGVRTILSELVPAFEGISRKIVPGAVPALDCPIVYPFAPNAVLIGFVSSFTGGLVSFALLASFLGPALGLALILPGMVPHFFTGGAAGVFGNATGGRRGAVFGGFVNGMLISFLPAFLLGVLGTLGFANTTFGDADFGWYGFLIGHTIKLGPVGGLIGLAALSAALLAGAIWVQKRFVDSGWQPAAKRTAWLAEQKEKAKAAKAATAATAAKAATAEPAAETKA